MRIVVTGAGGFIGRAVIAELRKNPSLDVVAATRNPTTIADPIRTIATPTRSDEPGWVSGLSGCSVVIHLAGLAHRRDTGSPSLRREFDEANHRRTARLAAEASSVGVRRMVFVSSIAVHGLASTKDAPIRPDSPMCPTTPYGESKARAEDALWAIAERTGLEIVVIRPPMVYGPDAPGNFGRLARLVAARMPMPFAGVDNRRSLVGRGNLASFLVRCSCHPDAANRTFTVSDGKDVSTPDIIRAIGRATRTPVIMFKLPTPVLHALLRLAGGARLPQQLLHSLQVDASESSMLMGWAPPHSMDECLCEYGA
jgi:nucleoside-diphosphate-sugar epimerase